MATLHPSDPRRGTVGDWTGSPELLRDAERWLAARGVGTVFGPMEMCSWFPHGCNLGPFDEAPFSFEPTEPPQRWLDQGYVAAAHYVSVVAQHDPHIGPAMDRAAALSAAGFRVQPLPLDPGEGTVSERDFHAALQSLHDVCARAEMSEPGYAPLSVDALMRAYSPLRQHMDPRLVFVARSPDGSPVGLLIGVPDRAQPDRRWFIIRDLIVAAEHRQRGVGAWLVAAVHHAAKRAGYRAGVHAMTHHRFHGRELRRDGAQVFRRYALLRKDLVPDLR